jgi:hypothetical protein
MINNSISRVGYAQVTNFWTSLDITLKGVNVHLDKRGVHACGFSDSSSKGIETLLYGIDGDDILTESKQSM